MVQLAVMVTMEATKDRAVTLLNHLPLTLIITAELARWLPPKEDRQHLQIKI